LQIFLRYRKINFELLFSSSPYATNNDTETLESFIFLCIFIIRKAVYSMGMIRAEKLVFEYDKRDEEGNVIGSHRAIDGVDIDVPQGSFVAILGHNGSGKSTLAKHMNAILVPTGGTMWVDGRDTKDPNELWNIRQSAGMVFQNPDNQIIGTVVEEEVGFGPENLGVPTDEIWKRVENSLRAVGMLERRKDSPNKLSGGQKQRVAIAGVIAMEPKCIVLDEPTAMLDPNGRKEVIEAVEQLREEKNVTVILITHYMEEVIDADQVFVMDEGHVVMHGTPKEIFSRVDELKKYRMDVPQVTMLADALIQKGVPLPKGILRREELVDALCQLS
jgi:energy-coupling factor transport system ATP-binding protein